jgi:hypothetical protein
LAHHHQLLTNVSGPVSRRGEIVRDTYSLRIPEELDAGRYTIRLGVWLPESRRRLRVWDGGWPTASYVANVEVVEVGGAAE